MDNQQAQPLTDAELQAMIEERAFLEARIATLELQRADLARRILTVTEGLLKLSAQASKDQNSVTLDLDTLRSWYEELAGTWR